MFMVSRIPLWTHSFYLTKSSTMFIFSSSTSYLHISHGWLILLQHCNCKFAYFSVAIMWIFEEITTHILNIVTVVFLVILSRQHLVLQFDISGIASESYIYTNKDMLNMRELLLRLKVPTRLIAQNQFAHVRLLLTKRILSPTRSV
jgi:hypothetical protein